LSKPTLLVADVDPRSLHILELALRKAGFSVETTADGAQALLRAPSVDLMVCEAALPTMDGIAVCRGLRAQPKLEAFPILITSADRTVAARAMEAGADEFLLKPILLKELVRRVQALLERRELSHGDGSAAITGSVRELGLVDALQALLAAKKSALVSCEAYGRSARVWVRAGQVVDAELGALTGDAALARLFTWESGSFKAEMVAVDREPRIAGGTEAALVEAMRHVEELGRVSGELAMTTLFAVDYDKLAEHLEELPDEVNGVVRNFDGRRTLREAVDLSPLDDLSTIAVVRRLMGNGILRPLEAKKTALAGNKPSLQQWLSSPTPQSGSPQRSLDEARAAALAEEMAAVEAVELATDRAAGGQVAAEVAQRPSLAQVAALEIVRFPPLRGVRRERLRREAEEARARIGEKRPVRLSRVVELPPHRQDGSDVLRDSRRMSPAVGEAAKRFAPDAPVARVNGGVFEEATQLLYRLEAKARPEHPTDAPEPVATPPIAPVAPITPAPDVAPVAPITPAPVAALAPVTPAVAPVAAVTPAPAAIVPGTPPPAPGREAAMRQARQPPKRPWGLFAAGAAILLVGAWFLRPQPRTDKKDAPWLERSFSAAQPVAVEPAAPPGEKGGEPPKAAETQKTDESQKAALPAEGGGTPASDQLYAKALEQGEAQLRRGKYRSAISEFQRAVKEKPQAVPALLALGDAFLEADKPRSALPPLELAARLDGRSGRAQLLLGTAYQSLGRNGQALKAYRRYLELEPQGEFARDVRLILANLYR